MKIQQYNTYKIKKYIRETKEQRYRTTFEDLKSHMPT